MKFQSQNRRGKTVTTKQRKRKGGTSRANPGIKAALQFSENDLPSPHVVDVELLRWRRRGAALGLGCRPSHQFSSETRYIHTLKRIL